MVPDHIVGIVGMCALSRFDRTSEEQCADASKQGTSMQASDNLCDLELAGTTVIGCAPVIPVSGGEVPAHPAAPAFQHGYEAQHRKCDLTC